jgi:hypothetical protein
MLMSGILRVNDEKTARDIAIEAAKSMWRYTIPSSFYEIEFDENGKCWKVEANYFEEKLSFTIDAVTGNVSSFKVERISQEE